MARYEVVRNPKAYEKAKARKQRAINKKEQRLSEQQRQRNEWIGSEVVLYVERRGKSLWAETHDELLKEFASKILASTSEEAVLEIGLGIVYAIGKGELMYEDPFIMDGVEYKAYSIPRPVYENATQTKPQHHQAAA
jgi:hypothetical protein